VHVQPVGELSRAGPAALRLIVAAGVKGEIGEEPVGRARRRVARWEGARREGGARFGRQQSAVDRLH
jgi:hypothetical protein